MTELKNNKICVLCGGRSGERDVSLRSGKNVFESLKRQGFNVISLDLEDDLISRLKAEKVDLVYIALHGKYGEDGVVQGLLEMAGIPYTGSKVLASALCMNKLAAKRVFTAMGIPTPHFLEINERSDLKAQAEIIAKSFSVPMVLKPTSEGSSLGVVLIKEPDMKNLENILKQAVDKFKDILIEEYIKGQEITIGVVGTGRDVQALPILELVPKNEFYDFEAKYTEGLTEFILPARLDEASYKKAQAIALDAHNALGCYGLSRVDMIVGQNKIPYVTEINSIPGMTDRSDLPAQAKYAGISFDELVCKILQSAF